MVLDKKTLRSVFFGIAGCIVLYWVLNDMERVQGFLGKIASMLSPFALGAGLAFILNVPMRAIENMEEIQKPTVRRLVAIVLTFIAFVLILTVVFLLLIPQIGATVETLAPQILTFVERTEVVLNNFLMDNPELMQWIYDNTGLESIDWGVLAQRALQVLGDSFSTIISGALSAIGSLTGAVVDLVVAVVFALYCLFRKEILARQGRQLLYAFLPEHWADNIIRVLRLTNSTFSNFLSGQCVEVCILGSLFAVSMWIFGMPYIPLISVLVAVTAFIPVVGAFVGCILGAFFILVEDPLLAVGFVIMFLILQQIENNMIYPRVVGHSIGLPGMWVLFAVMIGGDIFGVAGMFLMIPLTSVVYTLLGEISLNRLEQRGIDSEKLRAQPPELRPAFSGKKKEETRSDWPLTKNDTEEAKTENPEDQ